MTAWAIILCAACFWAGVAAGLVMLFHLPAIIVPAAFLVFGGVAARAVYAVRDGIRLE